MTSALAIGHDAIGSVLPIVLDVGFGLGALNRRLMAGLRRAPADDRRWLAAALAAALADGRALRVRVVPGRAGGLVAAIEPTEAFATVTRHIEAGAWAVARQDLLAMGVHGSAPAG